ncbi:hypothetical protein DGI_1632 [Megalodesulfovibrio gigas DSM 1382 = ATCC 19364]|uniref:Uncharacterized protein n=1 Tax=Megalodesulfovibrio gigas (strain ATCC 19364 / DSM 1382 / NCIMB 9332 / VKM B-1759) TaxID=1121448 RepID=T2GA36_MEGG1|nr:hypothetical protein DGI_1632 [Megalodesulfovibrio gigas DSM 1382 = ATCC 19364]
MGLQRLTSLCFLHFKLVLTYLFDLIIKFLELFQPLR